MIAVVDSTWHRMVHNDKLASDLGKILLRIDGYTYFLHADEKGPGERGSLLILARIETLRTNKIRGIE